MLDRPRLSRVLSSCWDVPVTMVVAPGGSGKTTLLAGFAHEADRSGKIVAWYEADASALDRAGFVSHLCEVLATTMRGLAIDGPTTELEHLLTVAHGYSGPDQLLFIDDAHVLIGSPAESVLEQLIDHRPGWLHCVVASRRPPRFDLSKLRVSDQLIEIGAEDLRFRSWEVEDLFRDHHPSDLTPEEVADLTRRTSGWAAGLHLFQLAVEGKSPVQRRQMLASLPTQLRSCREFLTRHVLADLDAETREFLARASVLGVMRGTWCDKLLERSGSEIVLRGLAERHLFLSTTDEVTFRMHEVLRGHLEQSLFEELGDMEARQWCERAAGILEAEGELGDAWRNFCRAQDWESAEKLLIRWGPDVIDPGAPWWDSMPVLSIGNDAWMMLAKARRQVLAGDWRRALLSFRQAEDMAEEVGLAATCRRERMALEGWVDPVAIAPVGWSGALRRALCGGLDSLPPLSPLPPGSGPVDRVVQALAHLVAGRVTAAWALVADGPEAPGRLVEHWGAILSGLSGWMLQRSPGQAAVATGAAGLETSLPTWMAGVLGAFVLGDLDALVSAVDAAAEVVRDYENPWLDATVMVVSGTCSIMAGRPDHAAAQLRRGRDASRRVGASALDAWCHVLAAVATSMGAQAEDMTVQRASLRSAAQAARAAECPAAALVARVVEAAHGGPALSVADQGDLSMADAGAWERLTALMLGRNGCAAAEAAHQPGAGPRGADALEASPGGGQGPDLTLRCFGALEMAVGGRAVDLDRLQPKVRAVLLLLAAECNRPVHRDRLIGALWPDEGTGASRALQVAVSSLRKFVAEAADRHDHAASPSVVHRGEGYMLDLGGGLSDTEAFDGALVRARAAQDDGTRATVSALGEAIALYRGDLFAHEGGSEWLVESREVFRRRAAEAAEQLASERLQEGDWPAAQRAARRGLEIDRYQDALWRTLIRAQQGCGDRAAAARSSREYQQVLVELGVPPTAT